MATKHSWRPWSRGSQPLPSTGLVTAGFCCMPSSVPGLRMTYGCGRWIGGQSRSCFSAQMRTSARASSRPMDDGWPTSRTSRGPSRFYVRPFPAGPGGQWQISASGGTQPRWSPDGKELYCIAPDGRLMAVPRERGDARARRARAAVPDTNRWAARPATTARNMTSLPMVGSLSTWRWTRLPRRLRSSRTGIPRRGSSARHCRRP